MTRHFGNVNIDRRPRLVLGYHFYPTVTATAALVGVRPFNGRVAVAFSPENAEEPGGVVEIPQRFPVVGAKAVR